jgi:hypothetical protein
MTPEERDIISRFVQRVAGSPAAGSVPATTFRRCFSNTRRRGIA